MLVRPAHAAVLTTCLRNLGWAPVAEGVGAPHAPAAPGLRLAVPAFPAGGGSHLRDPAIWQWWALADPGAWCGADQSPEPRALCLRRVLAVALGDASLAELILAHGPQWAPAPAGPGAASARAQAGGAALAQGVPAAAVKD